MTNKDKIFKISGLIGTFFTILSFIIMILTLLTVDRVKKLVETSKNWIIKIEITESQNSIDVTVPVIRIKGKVEFYTSAAETINKGPVNLIMHQKSIILLCFVRPLIPRKSNQNGYYLQPKLIVHRNGGFEGIISFGYAKEDDLETEYQIIVLAVPQKSVPAGLIHADLPFYLASSNIVVVKWGGHRLER
ncbi:MAG: hypothetical protein GTO45_22305 [Candidatus Aminicenantes bacterium]|nr:hypothetical protein [Candidatus Aminicenantes bacterium]NIM81498.1 hypothetical protein [Candidatus Aminicenantes bacterium]NIN20868.1 hypothetical protein [Candidatus Aminicenantes bacterium]NIN44689.1 hypothetical protein [Candidatus Aminicenantes bacterium]NIN87497.1 hypothetical protein [Candidatus Aminicenantes bacterium]